MAFQCGSGNDVCQGKTGRYKIQYGVPSPGRLEYQYPGEGLQVIQGDGLTYTTQQEPPLFMGGQCNAKYNLYWKSRQFTNAPHDCVTTMLSGLNESGQIWGPVNIRMAEKGGGCGGYFRLQLFSHGPGFRARFPTGYWENIAYFYHHSLRDLEVQVIRLDGQPDNCGNPPPGDCTFKVFQSGTQIFSRVAPNCPTVNVVNCSLGSDRETFDIVNSNPNKTLDIVQSLANNVRSTSIKLGGTTVKKLDSPTGCNLYPEVCYECQGEECPPGTCECTRGTRVCCYDPMTGKAVKSFIR